MAARRLVVVVCVLASVPVAHAADWPHWLGPNRNGSSPETGLLTTWPASGPKVLWKVPGGDGYSSIAVAGGRAITLVQRDGEELVLALDAAKGTELWHKKIAPAFKNQYGNGPRSTPTIDGELVYVQSVSGPLVCLKADSGDIVWQKDLLTEFKAKNLPWGLCASPLIDGDVVYALPGSETTGIAAFDKRTGKQVGDSTDDKAAYATPMPVTVGGKKQIVFFTAVGLVALEPDSKKVLWRVPWKTEFDCNIATPLVVDGDKLFVSSGEKVGCALFQLKPDGPPAELWRFKAKKSPMTNYWANAVLHEGHLYGFSGEFDQTINLNCVEVKTGKLKWSKEDFGKGSVMLADGHLFMTTKAGDLVLARASADKYEEKSRVSMLGQNRTVPTLANKRLYLRDLKNIVCVDLTP